jgi:predicted nucleic acid-binding protein
VATQLYLVDTSVWIFALRRNAPETIRRRLGDLLDLDAVATCGLIELELLGGTRDEAEFNRLRARLSGLRRLPIEPGDWTDAARLAFDLRRLGITVPFTDALLAAIARRNGIVLLHADRDFDLMAGHIDLVIESLVGVVEE